MLSYKNNGAVENTRINMFLEPLVMKNNISLESMFLLSKTQEEDEVMMTGPPFTTVSTLSTTKEEKREKRGICPIWCCCCYSCACCDCSSRGWFCPTAALYDCGDCCDPCADCSVI